LATACGDDASKAKTATDAGDGEKLPAGDAGQTLAPGDAATVDAARADPPSMIGAPYNSCKVDSDCAWGEIKHEILKKLDCVCLYGCPYLPLAKSAVSRRAQQHSDLCDPRSDGNGDPCGIDDCALPPPIVCEDGTCVAGDAGSARR
jgi:hypothetical protein